MKPEKDYDLVIVGSGIAGLSFALMLRRQAFSGNFYKKIRQNPIQIMHRVE